MYVYYSILPIILRMAICPFILSQPWESLNCVGSVRQASYIYFYKKKPRKKEAS